MTPFRDFAELCEKLESTSKRKVMVGLVASFVLQVETEEIGPVTSLLLGRVLSRWDQRVLEVSWTTLSNTIRKLTVTGSKAFFRAVNNTGDVGDAAKLMFEKGKISKQATLFHKHLSILEVKRTFETIAETVGPGSRERKERVLETLLGSATPLEAKFLVRVLIGEMRIGFHEGLMEQAIAQAFDIPLDVVQTANMLLGDVEETATVAKRNGKAGLLKTDIKVFRPINPMLAQTATVSEALENHGGKTALEYKLDGARIQIHKSGRSVKIFSRRSNDVTQSLPEIVELVQNHVKSHEAILEGEVIAVGKNGSPMLFQHVMRRFRRIRGIKSAKEKTPIQLYLFDVHYVDGKSLINESYIQRRKKLAEIAGKIPMTKQIIAEDHALAERFLKESLEAGHEGLVAKKLDSPYTPGVRGKRWLKIKKILDLLDLVIVAAEYGYGRRHGWLSDYYLAARNEETQEPVKVGKTFKGLTDVEIIEVTQQLKQLTLRNEGHRVIVEPKIVVEVAYNEIQKSLHYKCGMALRFARITKIRYDKSFDEVDTIQRIKAIYEKQFEKKARYLKS